MHTQQQQTCTPLPVNRFVEDGIPGEVRANRTHAVFTALHLLLIAAADVFALTFKMAPLYSLIIEQFRHKIGFCALNEAA